MLDCFHLAYSHTDRKDLGWKPRNARAGELRQRPGALKTQQLAQAHPDLAQDPELPPAAPPSTNGAPADCSTLKVLSKHDIHRRLFSVRL